MVVRAAQVKSGGREIGLARIGDHRRAIVKMGDDRN